MVAPVYNSSNWFWSVAGSTSQVWSSARCSYVPVTDPAYVEWRASGCVATPIESAGSLFNVLLAAWVPGLLALGLNIVSTSNPALNGNYNIADQATNITAVATGIAAGKPLPGGGSTFNYPDSSSVMHAFTAANFMDFAIAVEGFVYNFEQALNALLNGQSATLPPNTVQIN